MLQWGQIVMSSSLPKGLWESISFFQKGESVTFSGCHFSTQPGYFFHNCKVAKAGHISKWHQYRVHSPLRERSILHSCHYERSCYPWSDGACRLVKQRHILQALFQAFRTGHIGSWVRGICTQTVYKHTEDMLMEPEPSEVQSENG